MKNILYILLLGLFGTTIFSQPKWEYPIRPGSEKWKGFSTHAEMVEACMIPEAIIKKMTTSELLEAWEKFPLKFDVFAFNSLQEGFEIQKNISEALKLLLSKNDAGVIVLQRYKKAKSFETQIYAKNYPEISINDFLMLKILLSQPEIKSKISNKSDLDFIENELKVGKSLKKTATSLDIRTPRGSYVQNTVRSDGADDPVQPWIFDVQESDRFWDSVYTQATRISSSTRTYNCHSYAWNVSEGGSATWIGLFSTSEEDIYWTDGSYDPVSESNCTKISYSGNHSAIPSGTADIYISKWGDGPIMRHNKNYTPGYGSPANFYRKSVDVPQDYSTISSAVGAAVSGQTVSVSAGNYTNPDGIFVPSGVTLQLNSGVNWSQSNLIMVYGTFYATGATFTGNDWGGIYILGPYGQINSCTISGASYGIFSSNSTISTAWSRFQNCGNGIYVSNYSSMSNGTGNVFSSNGNDVYGDGTSVPYLGDLVYGYNSFRNPGSYQVYSSNTNATIQAGGNYWGYGPFVTANVNASDPLNYDPNPAISSPGFKDVVITNSSLLKSQKTINSSSLQKDPKVEKLDKANQLYYIGKYSAALAEFEKLIDEYPNDMTGEISLVFSERCLDKLDRKTEIMDKLNSISQNKSGNKISKFADLRKVYQYINKGEIDNAIDQAKITLKNDDDITHIKMALFDLGNMYYHNKKDKANGEAFYRELIKQFPNDILSNMSLMAMGEWKPKEKDNKNISAVNINNSKLISNYPNPFNPSTTISYNIPKEGRVKLVVYDILGKEIKILVNEVKKVGSYSTQFDANKLSSGNYFCRIFITPSNGEKMIVQQKQMQVLK